MADKIIDHNQVQSSFRITLTAEVRARLKVKVGDVVLYVDDGRGNILLRKGKLSEVRE